MLKRERPPFRGTESHMAESMKLDIITAERTVFSALIELVLAPGIEGELGILPHHAGLMTILQPGELMIRKDGTETFFAIAGGFMEVLDNKVTILADAAENSEEINEERAALAMEKAQALVASRESDVDLEKALQQIRRAQARLDVARKRRIRNRR
jgi:F-type H+-transporting ATPase subunit epsilon